MKNIITLFFLSTLIFPTKAQIDLEKLALETFDLANLNYNTYHYNPEKFDNVSPVALDKFFERGRDKMERGYPEEAIKDFNKSISLHKDFGTTYYYRGICWLELDSMNVAKSDMQKAIFYDSKIVEAYNELGRIFFYSNHLDSAQGAFYRAIKVEPEYPLSYFNLGIIDYSVGRTARANRNFKKALKYNPEFAPAHLMQGVIDMFERGMFKLAIKDFNRVLECDPTYIEGYMLRGLINFFEKEYPYALADINKVIKLDDTNAGAYFFRSLIYIRHEKNYEAAVDDIAEAYSFNPLNTNRTIRSKQRDLEYVISYYKENRFKMSPMTRSKIAEGISYLFMEEFHDARSAFGKVTKRDQDLGFGWFLRGLCNFYMLNKSDALKDFNKALSKDNEIYDAYKKRAEIYANRNEMEKAYLDYGEMLELEPSEILVYRLRGMLYMSNSKIEKAIDDFSEYLKVDSTDIDILVNYGSCLAALEKHQEALPFFDKYLKVEPYNLEMLQQRMKSRYVVQDFEGVVADSDTIIILSKNDFSANFYRGLAKLELEEFTEAEYSLTQVLKQDSRNYNAKINRAVARFAQGNYKYATDDLESVIQFKPNVPNAYFILAQVKNAEQKDGCKYLKKAIELGWQIKKTEYEEICP